MNGARYSATRAMARRPPRRTGAVRATTRTAPRLGESPPAPWREAVMALACTMGMTRPLAMRKTTANTPPRIGSLSPREM